MHVVNDIQCGHVLGSQPIHEAVHTGHHGVEIQYFVQNRFGFRADLFFGFFIHTAVNRVQHGFGQVGAGTEELHLFADNHRAHAAGNGVIIAIEIRAHQIIVFVLDRRSVDGYFGAEVFETFRQLFRPQYSDVRLRRRTHVVQGVQEAEAVFGHQCTAVQAHTADGFGGPNRVAGEQFIVFRGAQETHHAQFHHQMVNQLLRFAFGQRTGFQVALDVDIQESCHAAKRHGGTVLRFHGSQIAEISPLYGFAGIGGRAGNIKAVARGHFFHLTQSFVLIVDFFAAADGFFQIFTGFQIGLQRIELSHFIGHQEIDTVKCDTAIVADNTAATVSIRQAGQHA